MSTTDPSIVGVELIGNLRDCDQQFLEELDAFSLRKRVSTLIEQQTLTELGAYYHQFDVGLTGIVALAESHIAFHTWPHEGFVSLNVFVCNYSRDNTARAHALFESIAALFLPNNVEKCEVTRPFCHSSQDT